MGRLEDRIKAMGLELPAPFRFPKENRTGCVQVGNILYVSGHALHASPGGGVKHQGKLGAEVTIEEGAAAARAVALSMLATLRAHTGDLDRVRRVVRLFGMVKCAPGFTQMPKVIDGASDLFYELFGPVNGQHARSAVGMAELPHNTPVEINGEFEVVL